MSGMHGAGAVVSYDIDAWDDLEPTKPATIYSHVAATGDDAVPTHPNFQISVNGTSVPVYAGYASATHGPFNRSADPETIRYGFCFWQQSSDGNCAVSVSVSGFECTQASVYPARMGVECSIDDNVVSFMLPELSVDSSPYFELRINELTNNNTADRVIYLGGNPKYPGEPDETTSGSVIYDGNRSHALSTKGTAAGLVRIFRPGWHILGGPNARWELNAGDWVVIQPGAVVNGHFYADNKDNVRITGGGIIKKPRQYENVPLSFVMMWGGNGCVYADITAYGSYKFQQQICHCSFFTQKWVRVLGWRNNADGINIFSSNNVVVEGCLIRSYDNGVSIKGIGDWRYFLDPTVDTNPGDGVNSYYLPIRRYSKQETDCFNIYVSNLLISSDIGAGIGIGPESACEEIYDIVFENIDFVSPDVRSIVSNTPYDATDIAHVHNIKYKNIYAYLPSVVINSSGGEQFNVIEYYCGDFATSAFFSDIWFDGIVVTVDDSDIANSVVRCVNKTQARNITIENYFINGLFIDTKTKANMVVFGVDEETLKFL